MARVPDRTPTAGTLALMRALILRGRISENVRSQAHAIVRGIPPLDDAARMRRMLAWVRAAVPFERDPRDVETLTTPDLLVERIQVHGEARGDCDEAATLLSALLESVGIKTRLVAVSIRPDRQFHHVAVEAQDARRTAARGGGWIYLDPYGPQEVGAMPQITNALRVAV